MRVKVMINIHTAAAGLYLARIVIWDYAGNMLHSEEAEHHFMPIRIVQKSITRRLYSLCRKNGWKIGQLREDFAYPFSIPADLDAIKRRTINNENTQTESTILHRQ
ncbi:hypothetical protein [Bacillus sp. AG4(2022)]|uniref:hypothetical protein n=1 Tax=Bacillus sp. AG4(2022) TaxID=2962594 RepID=UPI002882AFE5|nr:hypothetical protein [Bacillus sp. AG4(2022)]MDT0161864.1 hypothetical protein [Bacillus sp. AG4(2022)]